MNETSSLSSLLGLALGGGCLAACIAADAGGLLHRLFTLALTPAPLPIAEEGCRGEGSLFLWPCSGRFAHEGLPRLGCYPTPCSMECGLSSTLH